MDPRWLPAVRVSKRLYDDMAALHGIPTAVDDGLWRALAAPPPLHSAAKTLRPGVARDRVLRAVEEYPGVAVADSFGDLDLADDGFRLIVDSAWIHHPGARPASVAPSWRRVETPDGLAAWTAGHGAQGVFVRAVLDHRQFALMARYDDGGLAAGFVVHDAGEGVGVSNAFVAPGAGLTWDEVMSVVGAVHPGRPVTDYTSGPDLDAALEVGFAAVGAQRVWLREG